MRRFLQLFFLGCHHRVLIKKPFSPIATAQWAWKHAHGNDEVALRIVLHLHKRINENA